jgi:hypothetical protein
MLAGVGVLVSDQHVQFAVAIYIRHRDCISVIAARIASLRRLERTIAIPQQYRD